MANKKLGIYEFFKFMKVVAYDSTIGPHSILHNVFLKSNPGALSHAQV